MRNGNAETWQQLRDLGLKNDKRRKRKQNYYDALAFATDPALIKKTLAHRPWTDRVCRRVVRSFWLSKVARESDRPDLVWGICQSETLRLCWRRSNALGANTYIPSLFTFFTDPNRTEELRSFASTHLSEAKREDRSKLAADEIRFRADLRKRLIEQVGALK